MFWSSKKYSYKAETWFESRQNLYSRWPMQTIRDLDNTQQIGAVSTEGHSPHKGT